MKKVLLGLCNNIDQHRIRIEIWARSFREHCDAEIKLLCANSSNEELEFCHKMGIKTIPIAIENSSQINHERLSEILKFIKEDTADYYLITDVYDVYFQDNPFTKISDYKLVVGSEGIKIGEEPWNGDNIKKLFPQFIDKCKDSEVLCSGVIGGCRDNIILLYEGMIGLCNISTNNHDIKDQAALNVLYCLNQINDLNILNLNDNWVCHCAVSGPTNFFNSWGFDNILKTNGLSCPIEREGIIFNDFGKFPIVHQYNRVKDWLEMISNKYE